ncbi:hypothetical protein [Azohydromonas aeria]|uniref:hypothetical protein n=1 Tax=Azohydromonas aeria TaxID=2590212 RepID=UPI0012F7135D|nr:hypothetical protein [Azohydromonas aeria]
MNRTELESPAYELHFESLRDSCSACDFPCDARGQVDMDRLNESALRLYLYARAVIGGIYRFPSVRRKAAC